MTGQTGNVDDVQYARSEDKTADLEGALNTMLLEGWGVPGEGHAKAEISSKRPFNFYCCTFEDADLS